MFFNLIGSTFGDYKVVSVAGKDKSRHTIYNKQARCNSWVQKYK